MKTPTQIKERPCAADPIKAIGFTLTAACLLVQFLLIFIFDII